MDRRILDIVSNQFLTKKIQVELELEKLINNAYNISVEETTERITKNVTKLTGVVHDIQMWESLLEQLVKEEPENKGE
jgi:hypothetical protein